MVFGGRGPTRNQSRRRFLGDAATWAGGILATPSLTGLLACSSPTRPGEDEPGQEKTGYGQLRPAGPHLALPEGFSYVLFGVEATPMSDGRPTPGRHDGMAAFPLPSGNIRLIRNHEDVDGPVGRPVGGLGAAYDPRGGGGTTSLEIEITPDGEPRLVRDFVSLGGTFFNCAGGPTPWGSWLSCEETTAGPLGGFARPHGYVFEVPSSAEEEVDATPLEAMGHFVHEAVAVDPLTGIVYETEDRLTGGFYRFVPEQPGNLAAGGRLQMLAVQGRPNYDTRTRQAARSPLPVTWVEIEDPDPLGAESNPLAVFGQGHAQGGAIFGRLEGCWYGDRGVYFISTNGGDRGLGQVWRYLPREKGAEVLFLVYESPGESVLDGPDNITLSPRGGLVICEDGGGQNYLRGIDGKGRLFDFALNLTNTREFCGATFSPDGQTLFVNIQGDGRSGAGNLGMTFAIRGPWGDGPL